MSTRKFGGAARLVALIVGIGVAAACSDATAPGGTGEAAVLLVQDGAASASVDARAPRLSLAGDVPLDAIAAIEITLSRIEAHRVDPEDDEGEGEGEGEGDGEGGPASPWVSLDVEATEPIDLLSLPTDGGIQVAGGTLPAGTYDQVRLFFSEATLVLDAPLDVQGGQVTLDPGAYPLFVPSGDQTGIKIHTTFEVVDGGTETVTLEIATTASVQTVVWAADRFLMTPVLTAK